MTRGFSLFTLVFCLHFLLSKAEEEIDLDKQDIKIDPIHFTKLPGSKISTKEELELITNESDMTFLHIFYTKASKNAYMTIPFIQAVSVKLEYLADIISTDCDNESNFSLCENKQDPNSFPRMKLLIPPKYKINPYTKEKSAYTELSYSQESVSESSIYNFVAKNIANKGIKLNEENHKAILKNPHFNKVLLFTDKPQSGLIFKGLSGYFYDRILFCEIHNSEEELVHQYSVKKFPALIIVETLEADLETQRDTSELHEYRGNLKAKDIAKFIEPFAQINKAYLSDKKKQSSDEYNKEKFIQTFIKKLSGENLVDNFEKLKEKRVILLLGSNDDAPEGIVSLARKVSGFFTFVRINCSEKDSSIFCSKFKTEYPSIYLMPETGFSWTSRVSSSLRIQSTLYEDLVSELKHEFSSEIIGLTSQTFQSFTYKTLNVDNKSPAIYFFSSGDMDIALQLMSLDEEVTKYVSFYGFADPTPAEMKQFGVQGLPNLVILGKDPLNAEK